MTYDNGLVVIHRIKKDNVTSISEKDILENNKYDGELIRLPHNDTGNAKRVILFLRDYVKFNQETQEWVFWTGKVWESKNALTYITKLAQAVMERYYIAVRKLEDLDDKTKKFLLTHSRTSNNSRNIQNMLDLLKHMNYVRELNSLPHLLNVQNGVVNLKTKELLPHRPEYNCSNICSCNYNPNAKSIRFKSFVHEILQDDYDLYHYLQKVLGYAITGTVREQKIFFLFGSGANGKSKLMEVICAVVGDYHGIFPISAITKTRNYAGSPTPELVPLVGKRLAYSSEIKANELINDSAIKQFTGGSKLLARKMRKEFTSTDILFKIIIDTNYTPQFKFYDYAIERRVVIIPFSKVYTEKERDNNIAEKLKADSEYILKWLVDGAYNYYNEGLKDIPVAVQDATTAFQSNTDSIGSFVKNVIIDAPGFSIKSSVLYQTYSTYCYESGFNAVDNKTFSQGLVNRGFKRKSKNTGSYFMNIQI